MVFIFLSCYLEIILALHQNQYLTVVDCGSKVSIRASKSSKGDFNSRK